MPKTKITEELANQWVHLRQKGHSFRSIARDYEVDPRTVQAWVQRDSEERGKQHWDAVSRQVDSKYLDEHYRLLLQTAVALLEAVCVDPVKVNEADPGRLLAIYTGGVLRRTEEIFKLRGLNPDVRASPYAPFENMENRAARMSRKLFDALMEHEPQLEKAIDDWKENWARFQQAQAELASAAKSLLEQMKVPKGIVDDVKSEVFREVMGVEFLGISKQRVSRINPQDGGKAGLIRSSPGYERAVCVASPDEINAAYKAYDKVLTQLSHQERLRPVVNTHRGLQESARTVEDMVERIVLIGKTQGRCSLCPDYSIRIPTKSRARQKL